LKKADPRVIRTRRLLRDALMALMAERDFDHITVHDITDHATLNHATFYLHYNNKEELLTQTLEELVEEMRVMTAPAEPVDLSSLDAPMQGNVKLFRYLAAHHAFYRGVLGAKGVPAFHTRMRSYVAETLRQRLTSVLNRQTAVKRVDLDMIVEFVAGAYMGVISWWLDNDMPISPEVLADQMTHLIGMGSYRMLGLTVPSDS
jgi:AcrR family transcriptional regulator